MGMKLQLNALELSADEHDVWLTFKASDGKIASISIAALAEKHGGIVGAALRQWAADQLTASRHYFKVGGDIDACAICGGDIRNSIHKRVGE